MASLLAALLRAVHRRTPPAGEGDGTPTRPRTFSDPEFSHLDAGGEGAGTTLPGERGTGMGALQPGEVEDFLAGTPMFVSSSNVSFVQFHPNPSDPRDGKMLVEYLGKNGKPARSYLYSSVSQEEALSFAQAPSKGAWCWDHLRVRGSRWKHRKPWTRVR